MPITVPKLKTILPAHPIQNLKIKIPQVLSDNKPANLNIKSYQYGNLSQILENIVGGLSKEDFIKIEKLKQQFSNLSKSELKQKHAQMCQTLFPDILTKHMLNHDKQNIYVYSPEMITAKIQSDLKNYVLELFALKRLIDKDLPRQSGVGYKEWFDTNLGLQNRKLACQRYEHPCDKVLKNTGAFNKEELEYIKSLEKLYDKLGFEEIWNSKRFVLNKINDLLNKANSDFMGSFRDKELERMKFLSAKYTALNRSQVKLGYNTKGIESVLCSNSNLFEKNEYVNGLGLVIDKINVDNKPVIITFSDAYKRHSFKMYDLEKLKERESFIEKIPDYLDTTQLNELNSKANTFINNQKSAKIAEIHFEVVDKDKFSKQLKVDQSKRDEIAKIIQDSKYIYYISSFENLKKKEYPSSAKILGIKLLSFLKDKNANPLFLKAEPYNGQHSPVSLYLRAGFKPISITREDVLKIMSNNHSEYIGEPVYMFLKDFGNAEKLIDKMRKLYFGV